MPGLNRHYYNGDYWPVKFESVYDEDIINWLEEHIYMVLLWPRPKDLDLLKETYINPANVEKLADAAESCWNAIKDMNLKKFSTAFRDSFNAQVRMFPAMVNKDVKDAIEKYSELALAWKLAGAGGGGYLIMISEKPIENAMRIKIRRKEMSL
jgi:hypothetical protein